MKDYSAVLLIIGIALVSIAFVYAAVKQCVCQAMFIIGAVLCAALSLLGILKIIDPNATNDLEGTLICTVGIAGLVIGGIIYKAVICAAAPKAQD